MGQGLLPRVLLPSWCCHAHGTWTPSAVSVQGLLPGAPPLGTELRSSETRSAVVPEAQRHRTRTEAQAATPSATHGACPHLGRAGVALDPDLICGRARLSVSRIYFVAAFVLLGSNKYCTLSSLLFLFLQVADNPLPLEGDCGNKGIAAGEMLCGLSGLCG